MASITEERLKEMEEEMNRFEEEISSAHPHMGRGRGRGGGPPKMIIGSNTYHQVQARLGSHDDPPGKLPQREAGPQSLPFAAGPPPPPPPPDMPHPRLQTPNHAPVPLRPPPPPPLGNPPGPPGPRPAFVPPQLRHRPPPPPRPPFPPQNMHHPPRPPMGPPRGMPPPPPMGGPHMGMPPHPNMPPNMGSYPMYPQPGMPPQGPSQPRKPPPVIEKPKIVYSAAPVRNVPKVEKQIVEKPKEAETKKPELPEKKPEPEPVVSVPELQVHQAPKALGPGLPTGMPFTMPTQGMPSQGMPTQGMPSQGMPMQGMPTQGMATQGMAMEVDTDALKKEKKEKKKKFVRMAAGTQWEDNTLGDWDQDDFRIFCGDLGNEVTEEVLARAFSRYPSFQKSRVVRDKRTNKTRGYGFVSFKDPNDFVRAMREMNGKYVGNRPIKLRKSAWKDRQSDIVKKKDKEKKRLGFR